MRKREDETEEYSFDGLARGVADGTLSRSKALKSLGAAILGGLLSIFALPSRDADAARRRLLKTLWAVADPTFTSITVTHSKGATGARKLGTGVHAIAFNRDVSGCACVATIESFDGSITATPRSFVGSEREVVVSTYDTQRDLADRSFSVVVHC